jgi:hypothetical protein
MNYHQQFFIALSSGIGYKNSNDVWVSLEEEGSATYLVVKYQVQEWVIGEHFLPFLKDILRKGVEAEHSSYPTCAQVAAMEQFESDYVLLSQSLRYELLELKATPQGVVSKPTDFTKIRVDMEVQPLKFSDWQIIGTKGIRFLYVNLLAAVNEHSQDKSQVKEAMIDMTKTDDGD